MPVPLRRLLWLAAAGFLAAVPAFVWPGTSWILPAYWCCLLLFAAADWLTIPRKKDLSAERSHARTLSIGADNPVSLSLENRSSRRAVCRLRDEYPPDFLVEEDTMSLRLDPRTVGRTAYRVRPLRKGPVSFGRIHCLAEGSFSLVGRLYKYDVPTQAKVYPNVMELGKFFRMASVNRLEQLGYRRREPGGETEFDHFRDYQSGDDSRRVNWKATARKNYPVVSVFEKEYNRSVLVLLDAGRMMTTRYGLLTKFDLSVDCALILAAAAKRQNDLLGYCAFADEILSFRPPSGRARKVLTDILPAFYDTNPVYLRSDYRLAYRTVKNRVRKNSIIFLFSELHSRAVSGELLTVLKLLGRRHRVFFASFEEHETAGEDRTAPAAIRRYLISEETREKESMISDLAKNGVSVLRVNEENIRRKVVNAFLSSR